jgi:UDPglucose 6-dehydrogenase
MPRMRVTVLGLWHLGSVTAACLAAGGHDVVGLDPDADVVAHLAVGRPPLHEPGLAELLADGIEAGRLRFTADPADALAGADVLWVTFDTPVDDEDRADVGAVRAHLEGVAGAIAPGTLVLISSQVPAGFSRALLDDWAERGVSVGCSPENLRLGKAIEAFRNPDRVVVGLSEPADRARVEELLAPFTDQIVWMSLESAEMTKHALNAFLATSVTFANELARLCELTGADAREVEAGLKSEVRIGPRAYLAPGAPFAGGTLARDVRFLQGFGDAGGVATPLLDGLLTSNEALAGWVRTHLATLSGDAPVAVLGLTYKPGTSTLRRSSAVALCAWLAEHGRTVRAFDPVADVPAGVLPDSVELAPTALDALKGAGAAVVATPWPEFRSLTGDDIVAAMLDPIVIDEGWSLAALADDPRITYVAPGRARR